ncbi:hypothetical protein WS81_09425 [Burkholderia sp. MSMB2040]|nr:hypothetical protein WS81_09425 [Burkholderia sp. MSMB2040]
MAGAHLFHATQAIDQRGFAIVGKLRGSLLRVGALTGAAMTDVQHALRTWKTRFRAKWSHSWSSSVRVSRSPRVGSGGGTVMALKWMATFLQRDPAECGHDGQQAEQERER